jgi:hypothetical protein
MTTTTIEQRIGDKVWHGDLTKPVRNKAGMWAMVVIVRSPEDRLVASYSIQASSYALTIDRAHKVMSEDLPERVGRGEL